MLIDWTIGKGLGGIGPGTEPVEGLFCATSFLIQSKY